MSETLDCESVVAFIRRQTDLIAQLKHELDRLATPAQTVDVGSMTLEQYVRIYKAASVSAISQMVGMSGTPSNHQLDASIEAGVKAVLDATPAQTEVVAWISPNSLLELKDEKYERIGGGYYSDAEVLSLPDDDTYLPLCIATHKAHLSEPRT